jgi:AcrR family transcriptional regulator
MATVLAELHGEVTERIILEAALRSLVREGEITARGAARQAGISERTVFRYFAARDALLDGAARFLLQSVRAPQPPATLGELRAMPRALYTAFDEHEELIRAAWHSELRSRIIATQARQRWQAIRRLVDAAAPRARERTRKLAAAGIRYYLSASTWHYYRFVFQFTPQETIEAAETAIELQLAALARSEPR